ncbi:hypothetical protein HKX48_003882 [Thoreauomyces humboldtii]|nr:hypothetical protein HKX48_003882 [Thoreauomyces humboldtii]
MTGDATPDPISDAFADLDLAFKEQGASIAVIHNSQVRYHCMGNRSQDPNDPVTPQTLFGIGSLSKAFTSFCVAKLVGRGRIDWEAPLSTQGDFGVAFSDPVVTDRCTLVDLLCHRSGLAEDEEAIPLYPGNDYLVRLPHIPLGRPFRTEFQYNNTTYTVAGNVAAKVSEVASRSYADMVQEEILDPLHMGSTFTTQKRFLAALKDTRRPLDVALPSEDGETLPIESNIWCDAIAPAASIVSNAEDMIKWARELLSCATQKKEGNSVSKKDLLEEAQTKMLFRGHMATDWRMFAKYPEFGDTQYGLGWMTTTYRGRRCLVHLGGTTAFNSSIWLFPEDDLAVVSLSNEMAGWTTNIAGPVVADRILFPTAPVTPSYPDRVHEWAEARRKRKEDAGAAEPSHGKKATVDSANDTVRYTHRGFGTVCVTSSTLVLQNPGLDELRWTLCEKLPSTSTSPLSSEQALTTSFIAVQERPAPYSEGLHEMEVRFEDREGGGRTLSFEVPGVPGWTDFVMEEKKATAVSAVL